MTPVNPSADARYALMYMTDGCRKLALSEFGERAEQFDLRCGGLAYDTITRMAAHAIKKTVFSGADYMVAFETPDAAVECAIELQRQSLRMREELGLWRDCGPKIGLSYGEFVRVEGEIYGPSASLAGTLESVAWKGMTLASGQLVELLQPGLRSRCKRFDPGELAWKFRKTPVEIWEITWANAK
jgi:class 3 adenylate cyclase